MSNFLAAKALVTEPTHVRRYKYLQKPLEERALPTLLQYINRWSDVQRDKVGVATALMIAQGLASASCLQSLTKDHLVKNGVLYPKNEGRCKS